MTMTSQNFELGSIYPYDPHQGFAYTPRPIQKWLAVTNDQPFLDTVTGARCCRALLVTGTGNVTLQFADGSTGTIPILAGNTPLYTVAFKVLSSGTTATGISWGY